VAETSRLAREVESFRGTWKGRPLWQGGYLEGDPLDPMGQSSYGAGGFMSVIHATYLAAIRPYVGGDTIALEIGPGRGAWTRCLLPAREVWTVDVLPAEHNGFWDYVGRHDHVRYVQVDDFSCDALPDDHFTYLFSFGCLCHVSFEGIAAYLENLRPKLRPGAECFLMVADYEKATRAADQSASILASRTAPMGKRGDLVRAAWKLSRRDRLPWSTMGQDADSEPRPGRWYDAGATRVAELLERLGYQVKDRDMCLTHRDPVIHFVG
jgi:hypothetical protein